MISKIRLLESYEKSQLSTDKSVILYIKDVVNELVEAVNSQECWNVNCNINRITPHEHKPKEEDYTPDGYHIVYISDYFWELIKKEMHKIERFNSNQIGGEVIALRDAPAQVEFRHRVELEDKKV